MAKYDLVTVNDEARLKEFYDSSAFTLVGVSVNDTEALLELLESEDMIKEEFTIYAYSGELMNGKYGLSGDIAYNDKLSFLTIMLDDFKPEKSGYLPIFKLKYGARWFDDIVDNNERHMSDE